MEYIITNSLIYGYLALLLGSIFAFKRYVNFAVGSFFIILSYILYEVINNGLSLDLFLLIIFLFVVYFYEVINNGLSLDLFLLIIFLFVVYFIVDYLIYNSFSDPKKRELFSIVFTLGLLVFIENTLALFKGSSVIGIYDVNIPSYLIYFFFILLNIVFFYILKLSFAAKSFQAIAENAGTIKSLGVNINKFLFPYFVFLLFVGIFVSYIYITGNTMRPFDGVFFLLKAIGIMVLVGVTKLEYSFIGAFLYVLLEYFLFINLGIEVTYKESLILIMILLILIFKPEGIFSFRSRKI